VRMHLRFLYGERYNFENKGISEDAVLVMPSISRLGSEKLTGLEGQKEVNVVTKKRSVGTGNLYGKAVGAA
jgi:hypothetical protein